MLPITNKLDYMLESPIINFFRIKSLWACQHLSDTMDYEASLTSRNHAIKWRVVFYDKTIGLYDQSVSDSD